MSQKPRPSNATIREMLREDNLGRSADLPAADPVSTVQMVLELDRITTYDRNPRKERNAEYHRIKESIRVQQGLTNPLTVTRRPGSERYMVHSGGNTRLNILKELWDETGNTAFHQVTCLFVPWVSEAHTLSAHLIENELRGEMVLIDKAFAVRDLKLLLEKEEGTALSRSAFQRRLEALGYALSRRQLIRFDYAINTLDTMIPHALRSGMGSRKIDEIRTAQKAYQTFCDGKTDQFEPLFMDIMSSHDDEGWDFDWVRRDLDARLAEILRLPCNQVRLAVDALLFEKSIAESEIDEEFSELAPPSTTVHKQNHKSVANTDSAMEDQVQTSAKGSETNSMTEQPVNATDRRNATNQSRGNDLQRTRSTNRTDTYFTKELDELSAKAMDCGSLAQNDLKTLRSKAYVIAAKFGQAFSITQCVRSANIGYGFLLEKPQSSFQQEGHWGSWWVLASLSEQMITSSRVELLANAGLEIPTLFDSDVDQAEKDHPAYRLLGFPPPFDQFPHAFLLSSEACPQPAFNDFCRLSECCRFIRGHFPESVLWDCLTVSQVRQSAIFKQLETTEEFGS